MAVTNEPTPLLHAQLSWVLAHLRRNFNNRPRKKKTLLSHLKSILGKEASEADAADLFEKLLAAGYVNVGEKDAMNYNV